jgi:glucose-1-phosphate cytidylyltransferase
MKVAILAGGFGTRLTEETVARPKPMVEIGGMPILWHIMKIYARHGLTDFVVLGGYKVEVIKQYFANYRINSADFTIDLKNGDITWRSNGAEPWKVTILDTGMSTMTGGRIKRAQEILGDETFCLTYGDGVSDVDIGALIRYHKNKGRWATVTAVEPPGRFGVLGLSQDREVVTAFREKDSRDVGVINGGFFVCAPNVFDLIEDDTTVWERKPMARLAHMGQLAAYVHSGYWQNMDTLRDRAVLEAAFEKGAPWLRSPKHPQAEG